MLQQAAPLLCSGACVAKTTEVNTAVAMCGAWSGRIGIVIRGRRRDCGGYRIISFILETLLKITKFFDPTMHGAMVLFCRLSVIVRLTDPTDHGMFLRKRSESARVDNIGMVFLCSQKELCMEMNAMRT